MDKIEFREREEKIEWWRDRRRGMTLESRYFCVYIFVAHLLNIKIHHPSTQVDSFQNQSRWLHFFICNFELLLGNYCTRKKERKGNIILMNKLKVKVILKVAEARKEKGASKKLMCNMCVASHTCTQTLYPFYPFIQFEACLVLASTLLPCLSVLFYLLWLVMMSVSVAWCDDVNMFFPILPFILSFSFAWNSLYF